MAKYNNKHERLIQAADKLVRQQGFNSTTLADIAKEANIPLGNVYYYFKSKEDLGKAIIAKHAERLEEQFKSWEKLPSIKDRLLALVYDYLKQAEDTARYGCSIGSLCQEFNKQGGELNTAASELMNRIYDWCYHQFKSITSQDNSSAYALHLLSGIQGMSLLTNTFRNPGLAAQQTRTLKAWLETV